MTVFRDGLIDLSRTKNGIPLVASMPHFLYGDEALVKSFNTKPDVSLHNTFVSRIFRIYSDNFLRLKLANRHSPAAGRSYLCA